MEIENYYVGYALYDSPPQDGKGNEIWDKIRVILTKKEFESLLPTPKGEQLNKGER